MLFCDKIHGLPSSQAVGAHAHTHAHAQRHTHKVKPLACEMTDAHLHLYTYTALVAILCFLLSSLSPSLPYCSRPVSGMFILRNEARGLVIVLDCFEAHLDHLSVHLLICQKLELGIMGTIFLCFFFPVFPCILYQPHLHLFLLSPVFLSLLLFEVLHI